MARRPISGRRATDVVASELRGGNLPSELVDQGLGVVRQHFLHEDRSTRDPYPNKQ